MKRVAIKTTIPEDHRLVVDVPTELPAGPVEVIVTALASSETDHPWTLGDLLGSGLVGMGKDRTDITDSLESASKLRQDAERRGRARD